MQKIIYKDARSSHVLICLGDSTYIHATDDGGVHLRFLFDEMKEIKDDWRIIRLRALPEEKEEELIRAGIYFIKQSYNHKFLLASDEKSSFCSELAGKIFNKASIQIFNDLPPHKLTPAHFDQEADKGVDWEDVTDECRKSYIDSDENHHRIVFDSLAFVIHGGRKRNQTKELFLGAIETLSPDNGKNIREEFDKTFSETKIRFWDQRKDD
ncbi:hypothetical protein [Paraglaciecola sp.]|uniref:hypothetical protein n=1 Tax=Paraglaciecola sp. TaxID=1920173 RepID=UPI003267F51D